MKLSDLNLRLIRRNRRPDARIKMERTHYGIKFFLPEALSEDELLKLFAVIPTNAYKLPENEGVVLDFQGRQCTRKFITRMLENVVWEKGIKVTAWLSGNEESANLFKNAGLIINEPPQEIRAGNAKNENEIEIETEQEKNFEERYPGLKVVYNSMRSGQLIETEGDVLVWGHLNAGAEIVAGGSVIVAGKLHGIVHAGGFGREDVFVWAGIFETPQVRIAKKLCYADSKSTAAWGKSVLITLEDGMPVIRENRFLKNL